MRSPKEPTGVWGAPVALLAAMLLAPLPAWAQTAPARNVSTGASKALAAIDAAAQNNKYLFVFFWKENNEQARSTFEVFRTAMTRMAAAADAVAVQITDPREKPVVDKFGVSRAPMPLVLALAPNGAVTKAWPIRFTGQQLREGFVSPCTAQCMKALQDQKLVVLCVQNQQTPAARTALQGALDFKADARFAAATRIVTLNPHDQAERAFLQDLQVDPATPQAVTVVLSPPGTPIAKFTGAVSKDQIVAKVTSAASGGCPGGKCGPNGCCPAPQK